MVETKQLVSVIHLLHNKYINAVKNNIYDINIKQTIMSARSLSSKVANYAAKSAVKSAAKSAGSLSSGEGSSVMDMVLMGAGVVIIILLLVYIYNRFIHKQPAKNEYFASTGTVPGCMCGKKVTEGKLSCVNCPQHAYHTRINI